MENFMLSKKTLAVIENFSKFLANDKAATKKIRLTPEWFEFKVSGAIGFFDASNEGNGGFNEIVIGDSKKFLDLVGKLGLQEAQFKEPFLYLKKGDVKVKYHTNINTSIKSIDKKILTNFGKDSNTLLIEPFELDINSINSFLSDSQMLGYDYIKFESKNNNLKLVSFDSNGIDGGYYEENLNIKIKDKISIVLNKEFIDKLIKGNYKVYFAKKAIKFESLDIPGLIYFLSPIDM